ncbi:MAG TPA: ASKHA domain-containing protein [Anaerolineae bacterium]|nr:ASKHA domain-containing protein [Anaerolineae bacterium]
MSEKKKHLVIFQPSGSRGRVAGGMTIVDASRKLGVELESVCGGQATCGKCKVRIEEGFFERFGIESSMDHLSPIEEREKDFFEKHTELTGYRLSCVTEIYGDVLIFVPEESRKGKQVVRKAATDRKIDVNPAVRNYYVEMTPATLEDTTGDWERLTEALQKEHGIKGLTIDYLALLSLQDTVRKGGWKVTVSVWMGKEVIAVFPGKVEESYGLAVDVGTTTVAGYLCELSSGKLLATDSMMNPQVTFGEDVMSRITYAMTHKDGLKRMNDAIIDGLNRLAGQVAAQAGIKRRDIVDWTIVGNTAMHHIYMNIYPEYIGKAPFPPAMHASMDVKARDMGLKISPGAYVYVLPIEAGFVGADNVGVLIAEEPYNRDDLILIIDIGTNGELVLGNKKKLISSSCATGPAFEGAHIKFGMRAAPGAIEKVQIDPETKEPRYKVIGKEQWSDELKEMGARGICGSGIIDVVAQMYVAGVMMKNGRVNIELDHPRMRQGEDGWEYVLAWADETSIGQDVTVNQSDIRAVQLAKGAMCAGAKLMMRRLGIKKLDRVILAGAFGSYIDPQQAMIMGLFPDCDLKKVYAVGNAAGDGARIALLNVNKRKEASEYARKVEYVELTVEGNFEKEFAQAMYFPHMKDKYPHLKGLIPDSDTGG